MKVALSLLIASVAVGAIRSVVWPLPASTTTIPTWFVLAMQGGTAVVLGLFILAIAFGRRWALIVFTIFFVLGLPVSVPPAIEQFETNRFGFAALSAQAIAQGVAVAILFMPPAREWFANHQRP